MKFINKIGFVVFIAVVMIAMGSIRSCKNKSDKINILQSKYDRLVFVCDSISKLSPDTIFSDPVFVKSDSVVYVFREIKEAEKTPHIYLDSIRNDSIDIKIHIRCDNLYSIGYFYRPVYKYQTIEINKKIPYPITTYVPQKVNERKLFGEAGIGYGYNQTAIKLGLFYETKRKSVFSYNFVRYGSQNIHLFGYGVQLW